MAKKKYVAYYRVSTNQQGRSGLGLEAQGAAIDNFLNGGDWSLAGEFTEIESGKNNDRPQLMAALEACQMTGATLLIAKLDRLSRDAHFLLGLQKANIKFVAADMPEATEFTVGIMAVVAQQERKMISERTKAALAAAKARGTKLGNPQNLNAEAAKLGRVKGMQSRMKKADEFANSLYPMISNLQNQGLSLTSIAHQLNEDEILSARGKTWVWTPTAVRNIIQRVEPKKP